ASVDPSSPPDSNVSNPPCGGLFVYTSVPWEYSPVSRVVRLGQHDGLTTNALVKSMPPATRSLWTVGMFTISSHRWSSVRIRIRLGRSALGPTPFPAPSAASGRAPVG